MFEWMRRIPHFGYGKCGGAKRDCSTTKPRDWMDLAFEAHDKELNKAETKEQKGNADSKLGKILRKGDKKLLGIWGRIYLFGAKFVFKP